jgi:hypothetical protein
MTLLGRISATGVIHRSARMRRRYQHLIDRLFEDTAAKVSRLLWTRLASQPQPDPTVQVGHADSVNGRSPHFAKRARNLPNFEVRRPWA